MKILPIFGFFAKKQSNMNKNTSISLGNYFNSFVENSISKVRFKNASELIRVGLRLLEEEESKVTALLSASSSNLSPTLINSLAFLNRTLEMLVS